MSGHSKWSTIRRQKEVRDAKRGAVFTKLARAISNAVVQGGGVSDPNLNFRLRLAVEKAKQFNMPKENIARAIERAAGGGGEALEEVVFEGFLPGGAVVLVSCLTDNRLRTNQSVREVLDKGGGSMGGQGAVSYMFEPKGEIRISATGLTDEDELRIIDLGVGDMETDKDEWILYCEKDQTFEMKRKVEDLGYQVAAAEILMRPTTLIEVADPIIRERIEAVLERLEDLDDVQKVWTNYLPA